MKLSESIRVGCYNCVRRSNPMKIGRKHQNRTYILNRWCQHNRMTTYSNRIKADEEHKPFPRLPLELKEQRICKQSTEQSVCKKRRWIGDFTKPLIINSKIEIVTNFRVGYVCICIYVCLCIYVFDLITIFNC
ncbi:hypothetical protein V8G54_018338 [Vigna mungo]|uniref:Uncharacterized protein n=1 Tax=Vigna mungo TaxID=3915 RepID=A0AAQ3N8L2_VIGMU